MNQSIIKIDDEKVQIKVETIRFLADINKFEKEKSNAINNKTNRR